MIFNNKTKLDSKNFKSFLKNFKSILINNLKVEELEEMFDFIVFYKNQGLNKIIDSENIEIINMDYTIPIVLDITTEYGCKNSELAFIVIEFGKNINLKYKISKEYIKIEEYELIETAIETTIQKTMNTLEDNSLKYCLKEISN